uniref:Uncharacterized protein n=1 Tax=uncultured bacterium r_02 TaxID=1132277 RepID=I6YKC7_9BACT|nr:hypothetical protein [uncultured bacterium r_02]
MSRGFLQLFSGERLFLAGYSLRVEDRLEEHVVSVFLGVFQLADSVTSARYVALITGGRLGEGIVDVDAPQLVLVFQVEMVVHGNLAPTVLTQQRQQTLGIHRRRAWLVQVKVL